MGTLTELGKIKLSRLRIYFFVAVFHARNERSRRTRLFLNEGVTAQRNEKKKRDFARHTCGVVVAEIFDRTRRREPYTLDSLT